ncbi:MAG: SpoIID/LytB domain-containing protein [Syntrophales bacterium]|jgi:stage II sporulation protein D
MKEEPTLKVGILQGYSEVAGRLNGPFSINDDRKLSGRFSARVRQGRIILTDAAEQEVSHAEEVCCTPLDNSTFTLIDVTIGVNFHWERKQEQTFRGELRLILDENGKLTAVNRIPLEDYLASVVSSEMNAEAVLEFLKAHAIASRSWLMSMLKMGGEAGHAEKSLPRPAPQTSEFIKYYHRVDHTLFDVCADDHCQRYQGITGLISENAREAVESTRGLFLVYNGEICDARYHKACGGLTDNFTNTWGNVAVPYLTSVSDSAIPYDPIRTEAEARQWILGDPEAYCNTNDKNALRRILPSFDQETTDFFRWKVTYTRAELEEIIREKSRMDFGNLLRLAPLERGPSGRIVRLQIAGSKMTLTVGKELEIRRWLSRSHLYSSAFVVDVRKDSSGLPASFILQGAGWGHGVGLCQIGAAVMALKGFTAESILKHYFRGAELRKLY